MYSNETYANNVNNEYLMIQHLGPLQIEAVRCGNRFPMIDYDLIYKINNAYILLNNSELSPLI